MLKNCVAVLSIGTSNVTFIIGERGVNNTFVFRALERVEYYAFENRELTDVKELEKVVSNLICDVVKRSEISEISKIFVGVSGDFSKILSKNYRIAFNKSKRITKKEIKYLYNIAFEDVDCEYSLIHRSAIYFVVDSLKTNSPIGKVGLSLSARISYALIDNSFKEVLSGILTRVGIKTVRFICEDYAEGQYLFDQSEYNACKILIDVGNVSTSLSISAGDGVLYSGTCPLGGGMITAYLYDKFGCDFEVAESLKRKINLGLRNNPSESYIVEDKNGQTHKFSRDDVNYVARDVLTKIAEGIERILSACPLKIPSDTDTYFTGGGVCYMRGAVEYLSTVISVLPKKVMPALPLYNKPEYSASLALLNCALNAVLNEKLFFSDN